MEIGGALKKNFRENGEEIMSLDQFLSSKRMSFDEALKGPSKPEMQQRSIIASILAALFFWM